MALSANAGLDTRSDNSAKRRSFVVVTSGVIYKHALVAINAAGTATPCANSATLTFVGLAVEDGTANFPITGDGTKRVTVEDDLDVRISAVTAVTVGMTGNTVIYAVDDAQVTNATTLGPEVGFVSQYEGANDVWVRLRGSQFGKAS